MSITLHGSAFRGRNEVGDFAWMIEQPDYDDVLFVFNDNEEQLRAFLFDSEHGSGCSRGGGNAVIRPFRCVDPPRAAGVPTGTLAGGGYPALTASARRAIADAMGVIDGLLATGRYRRIFYSAAPDGSLGTGIFTVGDEVRAHIVEELRRRASGGGEGGPVAP